MHQRKIVLLLLLTVVLAGCGGQPTVLPTPLATAPAAAEVVRRSRSGDVVASGHIVPARKAGLSFTLSGRAASVPKHSPQRSESIIRSRSTMVRSKPWFLSSPWRTFSAI